MEKNPLRSIEDSWNWILSNLSPKEMNALFLVAYRVLQNEDDADDIMQEGLLRAATNLYLLRKPHKLFQWLYSIVRFEAYAYKRSNVLYPQAAQEKLARVLTDPSSSANLTFNTEYQALLAVDNEEVRQMIEALPSPAKEIIILHLFDGYQLIEVAQILHMNYHTVRSRYRRTLLHLKQTMEEARSNETEAQ